LYYFYLTGIIQETVTAFTKGWLAASEGLPLATKALLPVIEEPLPPTK
jgi:hypothetical protein